MPSVRGVCRLFLVAFALLYAAALAVFLIGTFGWMGSEADPLAGAFLVPVGLPWNRMIGLFPESFWPWLAAAAPFLNLALMTGFCRRLGHRAER